MDVASSSYKWDGLDGYLSGSTLRAPYDKRMSCEVFPYLFVAFFALTNETESLAIL